MRQCSNIISSSLSRLFILFAFILHPVFLPDAGAQTDSLYMSLDGTVLVSQRATSLLKSVSEGAMKVDLEMLQHLPKILGNTDPMQFVRLLPAVQTNSECDAGIHIQGCDNAHNDISIGGVPVYGANHLLGLFSVFNPSHYQQMEYSISTPSNRLGGRVMMSLPDTLKKNVTGDFSAGLMSSQGMLGFRLGKNSHLRLSARRSYLNFLYGRWLMVLESEMKYGFGDYNFTYFYTPTSRDRVWADFYCGNDKVNLDEQSFNMNLGVDWGNLAGGIHWEHSGSSFWHRHTLFYSGYSSTVRVDQDGADVILPSYISSAGYKGHLRWKGLKAAADVTLYEAQPQYPHIEGVINSTESAIDVQRGLEASASAGYAVTFADRFGVDASLKGSMFLSEDARPQYALSPDLTLSYDFYRFGRLKGTYAWRTQYLFQAGLSNVGLPLEFWILSGRYGRPQHSQSADLSYEAELLGGVLSLSAGLFGKVLYNQMEYKGDILDLLLSKYDLNEKLLKGKGWNYGVNFMLHKQSGDFTGWVSYSLGRAVRRFDHPDYKGIYPANHERIHDLNVVGSYQSGRWNFAGTFVFASGLPFTAPRSFYVSSGQIVADYGGHNACRMRPYVRLDLSVTCSIIKNEKQENGINFSLYNAFGRKNDIMYKIRIDDKGYRFSPASIPMRFMPSISYYHKF